MHGRGIFEQKDIAFDRWSAGRPGPGERLGEPTWLVWYGAGLSVQRRRFERTQASAPQSMPAVHGQRWLPDPPPCSAVYRVSVFIRSTGTCRRTGSGDEGRHGADDLQPTCGRNLEALQRHLRYPVSDTNYNDTCCCGGQFVRRPRDPDRRRAADWPRGAHRRISSTPVPTPATA